jgi:hypothetical protein
MSIKEVLYNLDAQPILYETRSGVMGNVPFFRFYKGQVLVDEQEMTLTSSRATFAARRAMQETKSDQERRFLEIASKIRPERDCNGLEHFIFQPEFEIQLMLDANKMQYLKMSMGQAYYVFDFDAHGGGIERSELGEKACNTVPFATMREVNQFFDEMHAWVRKFIR